jgi:hypothetical protein
MNDPDMADVACPLLDCGSPLHLVRHTDRAFYMGDFKDATPLDASDFHTETWEVSCERGHLVMLPGEEHGCEAVGCPDPGGEGCTHPDADFDWSDDSRTFRSHDLGRLYKLMQGSKS